MYVVRRAFRNNGQMMAPGSIVEPGAVKRFKYRLNDGHIVEVTEQNFAKWDKYFRVRIGVAIAVPATPEATVDEPKSEAVVEEPKVVKPKATVVVKAH